MSTGTKDTLDTFRQQIDRIDDTLHNLLIERSVIVEKIGVLKGSDNLTMISPAREAQILRRLLAQHHGPFPRVTLVRLWREMISGMISVQGPMSVAVYMPDRGGGYLELARDHYGSNTTMTPLRSPGQVVHAVAEGSAVVGILPMPDSDDADGWWNNLLSDNPEIPRIVGRLPFSGPGPGRGDGIEALAVAQLTPTATGYDRSWLGLEAVPNVSRARLRSALGAVGIEPIHLVATQRSGEVWHYLVEVAGHLSPDDRRLTRLVEGSQTVVRAFVLGGYPVPLAAEELGD
jgi:chorismate mutase